MRYERRNPDGGGSCLPHLGCDPGKNLRYLCDITKVTSVVRGTAAGTTATLTMQLNRCNFFQTCGARFWAIDNAAASTNRRAEIQSVEINSCAQECGSAAALAAANVDMVALIDDYTVVDFPFGVPVCWGIWARNTFAEVLTIGYSNIDVAAIDFYHTSFGNACPSLPPGCDLGVPGIKGFK